MIGDAIESALRQDPPPLEIVVCDDGSTDDLAAALEPFGTAIRSLRIEHGGEAAAKNAAAQAASGDFLAVLDADDVYLPGRLAAFEELATHRPDLEILTTDAYLDVGGAIVGTVYNDDNPFVVDDQPTAILVRNFVFGLVAVQRLPFLDAGGFDQRIRYTTDWECWVRMVLDGARVGLVNEALAQYRLHETSMSARRRDMAEGRCQTLEMALARPDLDDDQRAVAVIALQDERCRLEREELRLALETHAPVAEVRRRATRLARNARHPRSARAKAAASVIAPRMAAALAARDVQRAWRTVGDRKVPRKTP